MSEDAKFAYDRWHERIGSGTQDSDPMAFPWYRTAFSGIRSNLRGNLLELGCGRGEFAMWLARAVPDIQVTGVDFSISGCSLETTFLHWSKSCRQKMTDGAVVADQRSMPK
jgi:ubiquinone/menaquinone biosynthesis C-methylase UbiE